MLIDAHSHVDRFRLVSSDFLDAALAQIVEHQIFTISNSIDLPSYRKNLEIGEACPWVLPVFGVHPWNATEAVDQLPTLDEAIEHTPLIGEIGLDHYFVENPARYPDQRKVFEYFLGAAREQNKIVTLHTKGAELEVLSLLDQYAMPRVIVHWYSGAMDSLRELIDLGAYFTVGVEVLYSAHIQAIAQTIPEGRLLTETDNPGGAREFSGEYGMPVLLKDVIREVARVRCTTEAAIIATVQANWQCLTRDDPWLVDVCRRWTDT